MAGADSTPAVAEGGSVDSGRSTVVFTIPGFLVINVATLKIIRDIVIGLGLLGNLAVAACTRSAVESGHKAAKEEIQQVKEYQAANTKALGEVKEHQAINSKKIDETKEKIADVDRKAETIKSAVMK